MKLKHLTRPLEIKAVNSEGTFEGYGSVFNVVDSYREIVLPGAFKETIAEHRKNNTAPALLWQHKADEPIGRYTHFEEDGRGLYMRGELFIDANVPLADKAYTLLQRKAVSGLSIGFSVPEGGEEYDQEGGVWNLTKLKLWETSIVTFPSNQDAQVTAVRAAGALEDIREFEQFLRDAGLSRTQAKALLSGGFNALNQKRDVEELGDVAFIQDIIQRMRFSL